MRRPLADDILLFSEALLQPTFSYPKINRKMSTTDYSSNHDNSNMQEEHVSYLRNELETLKEIVDFL